jgi:transposase
MGEAVDSLDSRYEALRPHLNEFQRRLFLGVEASQLGAGGVRLVAEATGVSADTVRRGRAEIAAGVAATPGRSRKPGGGRKPAEVHDERLTGALEALIEPSSRGDPESPLRWTTMSTRRLAKALTEQGHPVSDYVVRRLLKYLGYSLQANAKTIEGNQHVDRDAQFVYLNNQADEHLRCGQPVISVDAKKKELVGDFKNSGQQWRPRGDPEPVRVHDFVDPVLGKANPYGIYDITANSGWAAVGVDHDTAAFAVNTIRSWWNTTGRQAYPEATRLLITADGGGSNGYRTRLWKTELAALATQTGLTITCCHLPPGTSKWNRIEHRLFSHISMNWRGRPLVSHDVIVNTIASTTTTAGLTVHAELDTNTYPTGITISNQDMRTLTDTGIWRPHDFHGEWNYTITPQPDTPKPD